MQKRRLSIVLLASFLILAFTSTGQAAGNVSFGARAGLGLNPDQFVVGLQASYGSVAKVFQFAPSFDIGFGDNMTTLVINGDFVLPFSLPRSSTRLYAGAGPTLGIYEPKGGGSDSEIGLTLVGGIMIPMASTNAYNLECRIGIGDVPDLRVLLGIAFGGGKR